MASKRNPLNWRYVGDTTRHVLESFSYQYTVRKGGLARDYNGTLDRAHEPCQKMTRLRHSDGEHSKDKKARGGPKLITAHSNNWKYTPFICFFYYFLSISVTPCFDYLPMLPLQVCYLPVQVFPSAGIPVGGCPPFPRPLHPPPVYDTGDPILK